MYIIKNALKNLGRNKGRNFLIGLITLAIIIAVSVSIVINTTVHSITANYKAKFGAEVMLFFDADVARKYTKLENPTTKQKMEISQSDLLQKTEYELSCSVVLDGLKALDEDALQNSSFSMSGGEGQLSANAKVKASSEPSISADFMEGKRSMVSGRAFEKPDECIVSHEFAELNGLNEGDTITATNDNPDSLQPHTFTICGIYQDNLPPSAAGFNHPLFHRGNEILTSMESAMGMGFFGERGDLNATYFLKDPAMLEAFQKEAKEKGLPEYYRANIDEQGYQKIVGPVEGIAGIVTTFLTIVLIFGGIILLFLSIMAVRERKYEIGVLRAMGMKRIKVVCGMVCESLMIALICLAVGLGVSILFAQPVANTLLENQLQLAEEQKQNQGMMVINPGADAQNTISEISVQLSPQAVLQIASLALVLVLVSSMAGILYITKFEPMKILSERG